jgi:hypothetical protein
MSISSEKPMRVHRQAAPAPVESEVRVRFWSVLVFLAAALLVIVSVAGFVVVRNLMLRPAPIAAAPTPPEAARPEAPKAEPLPLKIALPILAAPQAKSPAPLRAVPSARLLESIGSLCAVQLYQSYLNVGLLADAVEHETYAKPEAAQILGTIVTLSQSVDGQLKKLTAEELERDDIESLERVRKASELVRNQATHLQAFWETGEKQHIESYRTSRAQCWQELQAILGLSEEKSEK